MFNSATRGLGMTEYVIHTYPTSEACFLLSNHHYHVLIHLLVSRNKQF